ncbi:MAG: PD-(D/E)XK nuclease family protein [Candidatus Pacebacteria bacterium]|nr:PD-(D/E)XK nuclease family protein [Candidatus Paceibacterota bacterium]
MSSYYNGQRKYNLFNPQSKEPFKLSRTKIDLFLKCPFCFYLDCRLGVSQPPGYPFSLNSAVDRLLKKEFDYYREKQTPHPLMQKNKIKAVPFFHEKLSEWQDSLRSGIQYLHPLTNFLIRGGVDDIWINSDQELLIVDYKATAKNSQVDIDQDWQISYNRQMEIYQWLFRQNGFKVNETGYFVYCNGITDKDFFNQKLEFDISVIPYKGSDDWVEKTIIKAKECLMSNNVPEASPECDFCLYRKSVNKVI